MQTPTDGTSRRTDPLTQQQKQSEQFADADLARELGELTRTANRANVTMYTIDPRGLVGMGDIDEQVDPPQWNEFVRKSQDSLRVIAEETGGIAVVNQNDFSKALKRIDAETSDYYVLGYYSKNPDATKRRRQIEVKVTRQGRDRSWFRKEYVLKPPPKPVVVDEEVGMQGGQRAGRDTRRHSIRPILPIRPTCPSRASPSACSVERLAVAVALGRVPHPRDRFLQVGLVDVRADEVHAEPRARDRRAAQAGERIHRHLDPVEPVQPQTLFRQPRRERRRVRPIAVAALNRLVRDEPRVAAAAHALAPPPASARCSTGPDRARRAPADRGRSRPAA